MLHEAVFQPSIRILFLALEVHSRHLIWHPFPYTKTKRVLMQQADHSFAVLHMHNYLCWESTLASWAWTNAQGRALVTATRVNTMLLQCEPMPGSVQSPAAEQSMLSKWRRTSLADNIARQKITISWEVLKFPHFFFVLFCLQKCRSRFPASQMTDQTAQDHRATPRAVSGLSPGTRKLSCQAVCDFGSLALECKC